MKKLHYIEKQYNTLQKVIVNNSPNGKQAKNIRIEHYSCNNENRIIIENTIQYKHFSFPFHANIGKNMNVNIVFNGVRDTARRKAIKEYGIREHLKDSYNKWIETDEEFFDVLCKIYRWQII